MRLLYDEGWVDPRRGQLVWMHVHIPKTGGTTLSNMLVCDFCHDKVCDEVDLSGWDGRCAWECPAAYIDTELHCMGFERGFVNGEMRREHAPLEVQRRRAETLLQITQASGVVYVTLLREGADRTISHWAHEMTSQPDFIIANGTSVGRYSKESLLWYISGANRDGSAWANFRNNMQIAMLASVPDGVKVERSDLERAKEVLSKDGRWKVGFTYCLSLFRMRLRGFRDEMLGNVTNTVDHRVATTSPGASLLQHDTSAEMLAGIMKQEDALPRMEHRTPAGLELPDEVVAEVERRNALDTELYIWAMKQKDKDRFIGAGQLQCWRPRFIKHRSGVVAAEETDPPEQNTSSALNDTATDTANSNAADNDPV